MAWRETEQVVGKKILPSNLESVEAAATVLVVGKRWARFEMVGRQTTCGIQRKRFP
jgi:hypothetical protein